MMYRAGGGLTAAPLHSPRVRCNATPSSVRCNATEWAMHLQVQRTEQFLQVLSTPSTEKYLHVQRTEQFLLFPCFVLDCVPPSKAPLCCTLPMVVHRLVGWCAKYGESFVRRWRELVRYALIYMAEIILIPASPSPRVTQPLSDFSGLCIWTYSSNSLRAFWSLVLLILL